jgi:TRAP transporter 4TM/12TM fusion protein
MARLVQILTILVALYHLFFVGGILDRMGIHLFLLSYRAGSLGGLLFLVFLLYPAKKKRSTDRLGWTDVLLMIMGVVPCLWMMLFADDYIEMHTRFEYLPATILAIPLLIALFEASRRTVDIAVVVIALLFFFYPLFQTHVPGVLGGKSFSLPQFCSYLLTNLESGIFGVAYGAAASIILVYVVFSQFLLVSGAGGFFLNIALSMLGKVRGGPAKVAVVSSAFFGTISGSVSANVAATGSLTIPMMKSTGYRPHFAGAVESVASNGGQIMPPVMGLVVFIMSDLTGIEYWKICVASILPALLYYMGLYIQIDLEAARTGLKGLAREKLPPLSKTMKKGWFYLVPLIALIVFLVVLQYPVELAGLYSIVVVIIVSFFSRESRLGPKRITHALEDGIKSFIMPAVVCGLVGVIIGGVMQTGMGIKLSGVLIDVSAGNLYVLLCLTAVCCYIMGMGLSSVPLYIMMVVLTAPALLKMGVEVMPAHLFVLWYGLTSFITPPVAIAVFVACAISGASTWRTGWTAMRLGMGTYLVPFMFVARPALLYFGADPQQIAMDFILSAMGIAAVCTGFSGYLLLPLSWIERSVLIIGGVLLCPPILTVNIGGLILVAIGVFIHTLKRRRVEDAGRI